MVRRRGEPPFFAIIPRKRPHQGGLFQGFRDTPDRLEGVARRRLDAPAASGCSPAAAACRSPGCRLSLSGSRLLSLAVGRAHGCPLLGLLGLLGGLRSNATAALVQQYCRRALPVTRDSGLLASRVLKVPGGNYHAVRA